MFNPPWVPSDRIGRAAGTPCGGESRLRGHIPPLPPPAPSPPAFRGRIPQTPPPVLRAPLPPV
eukprot:4107961-Prymnesium_polylepis.1